MAYADPIIAFPGQKSRLSVFFNRDELTCILNIYGKMVAAGLVKDYAINEGQKQVTFAIFRRASENPAFRIIKDPALRKKQGQYLVLGSEGQVLKRGNELKHILRVFQPKLLRLVRL